MKGNQKEVVQALMKYVGKEQKEVKGDFVIYECPKPTCPTGKISFQSGAGYQNPYRHLKACYGRGRSAGEQETVLQGMYAEARQATAAAGGTLRSHFKSDTLSDYENAVYSYVQLIVLESCPFTIVTSPVYRRIIKFQSHVNGQIVQDTIIKMVELVEKKIEREIKDVKGALLFDGWSKRGVHYVAILASYMQDVPVKTLDVLTTESVQRVSLIALSPMAKVTETQNSKDSSAAPVHVLEQSTGDDCSTEHACVAENEAETFNAATHIQFMRDNLSYFCCNFDDWVVCLISDNCSFNRKISADTSKPLVGCLNHRLNLQVNKMFKCSPELQSQLDTVNETMNAAKALKNAAILRNLTYIRPILPNATRWTSKSSTFTRYVRMKDDLSVASTDENATIPIDRSSQFNSKIAKSAGMLEQLEMVTKKLQLRGRTLSHCRRDIADLQLGIKKAVRKPSWKLHNCKLADEYIRPNSHLTTDPDSESGIVKLQDGEANQLTDAEKHAVRMLEKNVEDEMSEMDRERGGDLNG